MGLFSFIETFFFVSLAITFILILLLVYHFRQRFNALEEKSDTMFELINNIVSELNAVRNEQHGFPPEQPNIMFHPENTNQMNVYSEDMHNSTYEQVDESGSDDESDSDDESVSDELSVKVIVLEDNDNELLSELPDDTFDNLEDSEHNVINSPEGLQEIQPIVVDKLQEDHLENVVQEEQSSIEEHTNDVYRKMTIQNLKALVITKGLCSDPSKMKKTELLKMLADEVTI